MYDCLLQIQGYFSEIVHFCERQDFGPRLKLNPIVFLSVLRPTEQRLFGLSFLRLMHINVSGSRENFIVVGPRNHYSGTWLVLINPAGGQGKAVALFKERVVPIFAEAAIPFEVIVSGERFPRKLNYLYGSEYTVFGCRSWWARLWNCSKNGSREIFCVDYCVGRR